MAGVIVIYATAARLEGTLDSPINGVSFGLGMVFIAHMLVRMLTSPPDQSPASASSRLAAR